MWLCTDDWKIYYSSDCGKNWILQFDDSTKTIFFNYIKFFDNNKGIALGDPISSDKPALVLKTFDGGRNWICVNDSFLVGCYSRDQFYPICFLNPDVGYFAASKLGTGGGKLYKTTDGGIHWAELSFPGNRIFMLKFYDEDLGFAYADKLPNQDELYRTIDGGKSWEKMNIQTKSVHHDIEFIPGDPSKVWLTDYYSIYFSADTGRTWVKQNLGDGDLKGRNIEFIDSLTGFLLCDYGKLYRTLNNGGNITWIVEKSGDLKSFNLFQNYPNPFNPITKFEFTIPEYGLVTLKIYDVLGKEIETIVDEELPAGTYKFQLNPKGLASGVYFYRLKAGRFVETKKMILLQ